MGTEKEEKVGPVYALYARVSHDDRIQDPEVQLMPMREYLRVRGYRWMEYVDKQTGRTIDRPGYRQAMDDIEKWDTFAVLFADRLTREGPERGKKEVRRMLENGKGFLILSAAIEIRGRMTATTELILDVLFALAAFESNIISERTRAGMERKRREIEEKGHTTSKRSGQIISSLGRQSSVSISIDQILKLRDEGMSLAEIAAELGSKKSTIHSILKRHFGSQ